MADLSSRRRVEAEAPVERRRVEHVRRLQQSGSGERPAGAPLRLITVGSVNRVKDPETVLECLALLRSRGVKATLDWIGEDTLGGEMQRRAAARGIEARFLGFKTQAELAPLLRSADLYVQGSRHESQGVAVLEGAASDPGTATPTLIDLVGVRFGREVPFSRRARELARLNASFLNSPLISRGLRLRFLRTYLAAGKRLPNDWKDWWKAIATATAAKVEKNRRSGRPLA